MKSERVLYGFHAVTALLRRDAASVREVYVDQTRRDARMLEFIAAAYIFYVRCALHIKLGIIAPFVRITDLGRNRIEFLDSLGAGFRAHPIECGNIRAKRHDQILHHGLRLGPCFGGKSALHVILSQGFAELPVGAGRQQVGCGVNVDHWHRRTPRL